MRKISRTRPCKKLNASSNLEDFIIKNDKLVEYVGPGGRVRGKKIDSNKSLDSSPRLDYTPYTPEQAEHLATTEWGFAVEGEMLGIIEDGEATTGGKFLGLSNAVDWGYVFDIPDEGIKTLQPVGREGGIRWYEEESDSSRSKRINASRSLNSNRSMSDLDKAVEVETYVTCSDAEARRYVGYLIAQKGCSVEDYDIDIDEDGTMSFIVTGPNSGRFEVTASLEGESHIYAMGR